uniref:Uncharacterized protein n=1 Tax=Timema bartmani TaxID=61472 RepID=A0A7R9F8W3_9NEOP|nr:unnamed protein product [Timema bartmani]
MEWASFICETVPFHSILARSHKFGRQNQSGGGYDDEDDDEGGYSYNGYYGGVDAGVDRLTIDWIAGDKVDRLTIYWIAGDKVDRLTIDWIAGDKVDRLTIDWIAGDKVDRLTIDWIAGDKVSSPMASLVLTGSSQMTADGFEKLPDQIIQYVEAPDLERPERSSGSYQWWKKLQAQCYSVLGTTNNVCLQGSTSLPSQQL